MWTELNLKEKEIRCKAYFCLLQVVLLAHPPCVLTTIFAIFTSWDHIQYTRSHILIEFPFQFRYCFSWCIIKSKHSVSISFRFLTIFNTQDVLISLHFRRNFRNFFNSPIPFASFSSALNAIKFKFFRGTRAATSSFMTGENKPFWQSIVSDFNAANCFKCFGSSITFLEWLKWVKCTFWMYWATDIRQSRLLLVLIADSFWGNCQLKSFLTK